MGIEDDHEHLAEQMKRAMASITATQPDVLVFCLRGTEIQARLVKMAQDAEAEAAKIKAATSQGSNVRPMRPRQAMPMGLPTPPGYEPLSEESQREMNEILAKSYLRAAQDFRFLAAHVDEDRLFRLATNDMASLGFMIGPLAHSGYR